MAALLTGGNLRCQPLVTTLPFVFVTLATEILQLLPANIVIENMAEKMHWKAKKPMKPTNLFNVQSTIRKNIETTSTKQTNIDKSRENELCSIKLVFASMDDNYEEKLKISDLRSALAHLGFHFTEKEARGLAPPGKNTLNLNEFIKIAQKQYKIRRHIDDAFRVFDDRNNGHIMKRDISRVANIIGIKMNDDDIVDMITAMDVEPVERNDKIEFELKRDDLKKLYFNYEI